jgi:hypothetical protein
MPAYDRELYSSRFARLLNEAMQKGKGNPRKALRWLDRKYKLLFALLFTRHKMEISDAYMDVREHILKRIQSEDEMEIEKGK